MSDQNMPRGNAAAIRSALKTIAELAEFVPPERCREASNEHTLMLVAEKARAALAAPPRNCDRFASFKEAFDTWCVEVNPKPNTPIAIFAIWLFTPAEGGAE